MLPSLLPSRSQESRPGKFGCHATAMTWEMCSKNPALPAHMTYVSTSSAAAASRIRLSSLSAAQIYARFGFLGSMIFDLSCPFCSLDTKEELALPALGPLESSIVMSLLGPQLLSISNKTVFSSALDRHRLRKC
ncbi:hypothetical protein KC317_g25 [Hortaea werneckii]|nr:hypothetical protein KC317_g25 [Hortaea werneckii]